MATFLIALEYAARLSRLRERKERIYRSPYTSAFNIDDKEFIKLFRLPKTEVRLLCQQLRTELQPQSEVRTALSVESKVLCALRFFASGSYQRCIGQDVTLVISQASVSRCVKTVSEALNKVLLLRKVYFPVQKDYPSIKKGFAEASGFPGVIGAIGCTHIAILAPPHNDPLYRRDDYVNEKGFCSINVQMVCDTNLRILNVNAKFPGCSENSFIWFTSRLRQFLEEDFAADNCDGWLIGDQGYALEPWLLVGFQNPQSAAEIAYNQALDKASNYIKQCNHVLKSRFRCLSGQRVLHYAPTTSSHIINACVILHNICIAQRVELPPDDFPVSDDSSVTDDPLGSDNSGDESESDDDDPSSEDLAKAALQKAAIVRRDNVVRQHFS